MIKVNDYMVHKTEQPLRIIRLNEIVVFDELPTHLTGWEYLTIQGGPPWKLGYYHRINNLELNQYFRPMTKAERVLFLKEKQNV